ncbi:MAG TPA: GTP 3',8-cyclase MoaA [Synergistales bacterium]|nr:GTP 3',8-cyclase MoaA [Synergistaceae bacterium]MDD3915817.1 GTP 3',8-cyclase MoaA [Synergistaceae bacterium]HOO87250.1 GTP 3',8-cyclase MoaA [Synergistales bacterium]HPE65123.1 GTP 3',8-cyclase MoaA [Synergistales bacterium]HRV97419.1 GTP 3',8-cyclase MoaA [Aminobacteriaceae bacterium]
MGRIMRDPYGRTLDYVRISITDRCNFRCLYCMPANGIAWIPHEDIMTYEDIFFLVSVLSELGVKRLRFTGGEPFVRKGFVSFLQEIRQRFPSIDVAVTTNGAFLERDASALSALRLHSVNVSLDTLHPQKFADITRTGELGTVLRGIRALVAKGGVSVKINTVVMRDFNLNEISGLVRFAKENDVLLRFIEFMPLDKDVWSNQQYVSASEILSLLPDALQWSPSPKSSVTTQNTSSAIPNGPAKYFRNAKTGQDIGIISAVSDHFCHTCNRLRITSTGEVRPCLFSNRGVAIIDALRRKDPDAARDGILMAVKNKPHEGGTGIPEERQNPEDAPQKRTDLFQEERHMSRIGG